MSAMVQMNTANENFYQKEIAEVQDEIDLEIEEQQIAEEVLEATPFTELETLNKGDNKMYVEKVQTVHSANVGEKQNGIHFQYIFVTVPELEKSFVEEDAVDELENEDEILSSKSEKRTRETNDTLQDQKRLKIDEDEIDIDMEEESNKFSTNPQENQQQQVADEEIEITEDANSQVSSNPIQSSVVVVEPKMRSRFLSVQKNDWSSLISELAHTLVTLGNLSLSDIYNLMLTCKSLNQFFNSHSDPWRSLALHSFTFKKSDSLMITKFAHFLDSWKEYCKIRKTYSLNIRNCILDALKNEDDDDSILDRMNSKLTILNNIRNMSNSFSARIMDSLNFDDNDDADLLFLVNNTYFSVSLEEGEEENTRVEREVIYVVGPYGDRIKVVKGKESQLQETIKELKGLRFTKDQYLEYINFYCCCCLTSIKKKSIYDIFTPLNTTVTTIDSTSEQQEVDIESEEEEEDVDIL